MVENNEQYLKRQLRRDQQDVPHTNILWVSRHSMTEEQAADLRRIYGPYNLLRYPDSVSSAEQIAEMARGCDVIAVVLPYNILVDLIDLIGDEKHIIRSRTKRRENTKPNGSKDDQPYEHLWWERIREARLVTERLEENN